LPASHLAVASRENQVLLVRPVLRAMRGLKARQALLALLGPSDLLVLPDLLGPPDLLVHPARQDQRAIQAQRKPSSAHCGQYREKREAVAAHTVRRVASLREDPQELNEELRPSTLALGDALPDSGASQSTGLGLSAAYHGLMVDHHEAGRYTWRDSDDLSQCQPSN
jgi:hypothetical protein